MTMFIVRHQHDGDRCPAMDPLVGASLLNYLSRPQVQQRGISIHGEAVVQGEHTMYLIVEANDAASVLRFMEPFSEAGTVELYPASTCARVVASGGCLAPLPVVDDVVPAVDPEDACQYAIDSGLVVHRAHPLNCETSIPALVGGVVMPNAHFYVRNHFQIPLLDASTWQLAVGGLVARPLQLALRDLHNLPTQTSIVTLECAGNGRASLDPPAEGEQWRVGAVSTAEWTGVPLAEVLDRAGVEDSAREVVFRGADNGTVAGRAEPVAFERSLTLGDARESGALLAWAMNGEPIPRQHGYPVRLVVPDWYGVASVKWLTAIEVTGERFDGYFQTDRYVYEYQRDSATTREPVSLQRVRAIICEPEADAVLDSHDVAIRGVAWSGAAAIAGVEVSIDGGPWQDARLVGERRRHSWQWWELITRLDGAGARRLRVRATDLADRTQPEQAEPNRFGYGNNAIQEIVVHTPDD